MYPAKFDYVAPSTLDEALKLLAEGGGDAKLLAGGHSLLPMMKLRLAEPAKLIDLRRVPGLNEIKVEPSGITIGAMVTHAQVASSPEIKRALPLLAEAEERVGDLQVRNRGTVGGSLAHADPAGDLPAVFLALEGEVVARGPRGERTIKAADFFVDILTTALAEEEIITQVRFPALAPRTGTSYQKFDHPASHYALTGVAAVATLGSGGSIERVRVGVTGVGPKAYRAEGVEQALAGKGGDAVRAAADKAADGIDCNDDIHASAEYRAHLARVFTRRALEEAIQRAGG
ncbi:MAG TPA: xanthine dehydrogenase family protein subunit M [Chloroflexota bacterium]|nr:xanthine dehydrogenase family protein subunit M [Chloroflexota bacterium]